MKRQNLTAITRKSHSLILRSTCIDFPNSINRHRARIEKATVNELIRLEAEDNQRKYNDGYNDGFECARLVERTNISCDCLGENQERICGNLKPIQP